MLTFGVPGMVQDGPLKGWWIKVQEYEVPKGYLVSRARNAEMDQTLVLDGVDRRRLRGRRVGVVDDVVSTGGSLKAVEALLSQAEASVVCRVAVLLEEGGYHGEDLLYLEKLPVFPEGR